MQEKALLPRLAQSGSGLRLQSNASYVLSEIVPVQVLLRKNSRVSRSFSELSGARKKLDGSNYRAGKFFFRMRFGSRAKPEGGLEMAGGIG
jgi:hypothetical protein